MPKVTVVGGNFKKNASGFFNNRFFSLPLDGDRTICESIQISEINYVNDASPELGKFYNLNDNISELKLATPKGQHLVLIRFNDKRNLIVQVERKYLPLLKSLFLNKEVSAIPA